MSRFPQQHHPTSFPKINLPIELMIQTWNHNLIWWYLFFPSKSMRHCPSCSITKISQPPSPFLKHNHSIASIISLPLGVFSLFFYILCLFIFNIFACSFANLNSQFFALHFIVNVFFMVSCCYIVM